MPMAPTVYPQFGLRSLGFMIALAAMLCASVTMLPSFPKFIPTFPLMVFAISVFGALPVVLLIAALRHRLGSNRFWSSLLLAVVFGSWAGVGSAHFCNAQHVGQPQWPGIGGAFIVWGAGFMAAVFVATITSFLVPRGGDRGDLPRQ